MNTSLDARVEIAIRQAIKIYKEPSYLAWAAKWLDGTDRSKESADASVDTTSYYADYYDYYAAVAAAYYAAVAASYYADAAASCNTADAAASCDAAAMQNRENANKIGIP